MYQDTDPQVQMEMAALILLIQRGDSADIERQEKTLRQTMEDRNRTDEDIIRAIETCYKRAGGAN
jgi:ParB-like chromosome segregation protein Spo0J